MDRRTFLSTTGGIAGVSLTGRGSATELLGGRVEIETDDYGVSHVYADSLYGVAYGQGYVQARDRMFQLEALRHIGYGDSASFLGTVQLQSDVNVSRDLYSEAELERIYEDAPDEAREALQAFSDGVNRHLIEMKWGNDLPGEYVVLPVDPDEWRPIDSIAAMSYLIGYFGVGGGNELRNAREFATLRERLGDDRAAYRAFGDRNWLEVPESHYTSIARAEKTVDGGESVPAFEDLPAEQLQYVDAALGAEPWGIDRTLYDNPIEKILDRSCGIMDSFKWGSNAMAVSGEHTATGQPMMFGGPQMGYFKPPVIHEVGLHGPEFDVAGVSVAATPGVIIGRTEEFAWSVTSGLDDMIDTVAVELDPNDRHRYRWDGEWGRMETRTVVHDPSETADFLQEGELDLSEEVVEQEVARIHEDGAVMPVVAWNPDENVAWVQRKTTRYDDLVGAYDWVRIGRQSDRAGVEEALSDVPYSFNFLYADEDDVAFYHTGKVPDRNPALDHRLPAPASMHEWSNVRSGLDLDTYDVNPSRGYYVNWNNAPAGGWRAGDGAQQWGSHHRVELLDEIVRDRIAATDHSLTADDIEAIVREAAERDVNAPESAPIMAAVGRSSDDPQLQAMAAQLDAWAADDYRWTDADDDDAYDHAGHAIWDETRRALQDRIFADELGDRVPDLQFEPVGDGRTHAANHGNTGAEVTFVDVLRGRTDHDWLDDDRDAVVRRGLAEAADTLASEFNSADPSDWLATEHEIEFRPLGATGANSIDMVNRGTWNQVVALGQGLDGARSILPPSNSGHIELTNLVLSRVDDGEPDRLTDQLDLYRNFEFKPFPLTEDEVDRVATESDTLYYLNW